MLPFFMDHNVHRAITDGLRHRGIDCRTAREDGLARSNDPILLHRATELGRVLFTQDTDFLAIASDWIETHRQFSGVVYGGQLSVTIGQAIFDLELIARSLTIEEIRNTIIHLPL